MNATAKVWVVIPVKDHSTRVPFKNFQTLGNIPLWKWTYREAARFASRMREHSVSTRIIVDTDSSLISKDTIYHPGSLRTRPHGLDDLSASEVVRLAVKDAGASYYDPVIMLLPTSPFRNAVDIYNAYDLWKNRSDIPLISVSEVESRKVVEDRDESVPILLSNGAIQIARYHELNDSGAFWGPSTECGYMPNTITLPGHRGLDIDTWYDLECARAIYRVMYS